MRRGSVGTRYGARFATVERETLVEGAREPNSLSLALCQRECLPFARRAGRPSALPETLLDPPCEVRQRLRLALYCRSCIGP